MVLATNSTAAQLEKMCRLYRGVQMLDREAEEVETWNRYLQSRDTEDGMVTITLKVLPDEAARFMKAAETCAGQRVSSAPPRPDVGPMSERPIAKLIADNRLASTTGDGVLPWPPAPGWNGVPLEYAACVQSLWT